MTRVAVRPPAIFSVPISLKLASQSKFWLHISNVNRGDPVFVIKSDFSKGYWKGNVSNAHPNNGNVVMVSVNYVDELPPVVVQGKRRKRVIGAGDVITVTITIENTGGIASIGPQSVILE